MLTEVRSPTPPPSSAAASRHGPSALPGSAPTPWWPASIAVGEGLLVIVVLIVLVPAPPVGTLAWWAVTLALHAPFALILLFLAAGAVERIGFLWRGRSPREHGRLPAQAPTVCIQVPLFNEDAVSARVIAAVGSLRWPDDRLEVQVLDDSTDPAARAIVDEAVRALRARRGLHASVLRRAERRGYKAGALEAGRRATDARFIAIFDADFMPTPDFLERVIPHFYTAEGAPDLGLALVQAQWGHLNAEQSALTRAQSLWVDDHHTAQMSWRAAQWDFVNFTGTAGIWRAAAIERAGGWRAASLVEDCELSYRALLAGYRTTFVRHVIAPAELPATFTAYKAQQRRWTQGWAQVQRLHLAALARHETSRPRRLHLLYHMCIPWQWPLWALWITILPAMIHAGLWFGALGLWHGIAVYLAPMAGWLMMSTVIASSATPQLHPDRVTRFGARLARVLPYVTINTGMLPHQFSAFLEGLVGPLHAEFERTPKTAAVSAASGAAPVSATRTPSSKRASARIHWPYVAAEACLVAYQLGWAIALLAAGHVWPGLGAMVLAACVLGVGVFYGDDVGKVLFAVDPATLRPRLRLRRAPAQRGTQTSLTRPL